MGVKEIIRKTQSLCPVCMKRIEARVRIFEDRAYMEKNCRDHGPFRTLIWKGTMPMNEWVRDKKRAYIKNPGTAIDRGCPFDCGLCPEHRQHTCMALIEVTGRCNLRCTFCFADSGLTGDKDPTLNAIMFQYKSVLKYSGACNVQLSGGEPTVRDDLPEIISMGKELGFPFIQVNTNGIRLGEDEDYVKRLKDAGLSSIYLQFDGTKDGIYKKLRGKELLNVKEKAIENCKKYGIGVVLVPTLVAGVNVDNIGGIIEFALGHVPAVRGVHFQPVSYFGRVPRIPGDNDRVTLPEIMAEIEKQTAGGIGLDSMQPPG